MARVPLARIVILQQHRIDQIAGIGTRTRERAPDALNKIILQTRISAVNERWAEINREHDAIVLRADAANHAYITGNTYDNMRQVYEDTSDWLLNALNALPGGEEGRNPRRRDREDDNYEARPAKLPRLELPTFSGRYEDWDSFADIFSSLVHDAPRIADTTKLQYLKSCMTGAAADLVKDVTIIGANYASTWKSLQDRFHNPRLAINRLLDLFSNLPYLKKESASDLRSFVDETQRIVRALTNLGMAVSHWDSWLVHSVEIRLDPESRKNWESELIVRDRELTVAVPPDERTNAMRMPKFDDLIAFLERRAQSLSVIHAEKDDIRCPPPSILNRGTRKIHHVQATQSNRSALPSRASKCSLCSGNHFIGRCPTFIAKEVGDRMTDARHLRLCFNCLGGHKFKACKSPYTCKTCHERHHTLLHNKRISSRGPSNNASSSAPTTQVIANTAQLVSDSNISCNTARAGKNPILLATAQVIVIGPDGKQTLARALLDQGAEATFISESLVQLLGLRKYRVEVTVTGVGGAEAGKIKSATYFTLKSRVASEFAIDVNAYVMPRLTSELPPRNLVELDFEQFRDLQLADPAFNLSGRIDIIIGADSYGAFLRAGLKRFRKTQLVAQDTALGWIISGPTHPRTSRRAASVRHAMLKVLQCTVNDDLSELLQRMWTVDEVPVTDKKWKPVDEACEKLFTDTHRRTSNGRFEVRLPLIGKPPGVAAETRRMAIASLKHQQQKFSRDPNTARAYADFMSAYLQLGHMERVPDDEVQNPRAWYLPHHAVIQNTPSQTKLRVVFDASRKTRDKQCLNDFLMAGPPLQSDLPMILLNWRRYRYAFTADIVKMFRQIRVSREDQDLQRIVWSPEPEKSPVDFRLLTVTYGTKSAPYLAIRTLQQLASDERTKFPLGAKCLDSNTYVDDTFSGADELATAKEKRDQLMGILKSAGIDLNKWAANHTELLPPSVQSIENAAIKHIDGDQSVKTLGVHWNPSADCFHFSAGNFEESARKNTKRTIYSEIAQLFDPLGWLAPVTVTAKILMQDLWIEKRDWDEPVSCEVREKWQQYCRSLSALPTLSINRWLGLSRHKSFEIHGFSDASSRAYAACVYIRVDEGYGKSRVMLLTAKTKASPVKTISIPNLELLGATLLVKLVCHLKGSKFLKDVPIHLWSDSQIVLMWLKKHPCHWKTFVANRVSYIQTELPSATWAHVPTKHNPADLATRGASPAELRTADLWWRGPAWLASPPPNWPQVPKSVQALHTKIEVGESTILSRYSTLTRLTRVTAWCLRPFLQFVRRKAGQGSFPLRLTTADLDHARIALVNLAQAHAFSKELKLLRAGSSLPKRDSLLRLKPFLDNNGTLRVGGRLSNANLPCHIQHPPILPRKSALSQLFVLDAHRRALHGGPTLTTSILLRFVWIVGMRSLVKTAVHKCITCQRHKPRLAHQLMGNLPVERLTPARPFTTTGLDYAGPLQVRTTKGRGHRAYKGYIALFICFTTKAIHLELVSDLTTATFIAAYRRFVSRRGLCKQLFSDNATTYRGADTELRRMFHAASEFYQNIASTLANDGTSWTFIPPTTPHYGGLWEAGVKSTKHLLKRTIGEHVLTFEELSTVLAEIEACLNSRPLCQLSSDSEDLQAYAIAFPHRNTFRSYPR